MKEPNAPKKLYSGLKFELIKPAASHDISKTYNSIANASPKRKRKKGGER